MTNKERFEKAVKAAKEKRYAKYFEGMPTHEQITVTAAPPTPPTPPTPPKTEI